MSAEVRGLAFYKRVKSPWTADEYNQIISHCENDTEPVDKDDIVGSTHYKYIYDSQYNTGKGGDTFMDLASTAGSNTFKACEKVCFETFFIPVILRRYNIEGYLYGK